MSGQRTFALALRLFLQVLRDRREMALIFIVPVVIMQLVSWVVRDSVSETMKVAVVAEGASDFYRPQLEDALVEVGGADAGQGAFEIVSPPTAAADPLGGDEVQAIFTFPKEFLPDRSAGKPGRIVVDVDGGDPGQVMLIAQGLQRSLVRVLSEIPITTPPGCPLSCTESINILPPDVEIRRAVGHDLELIDFYLPAIVPYLAFFFGFMMTALSFLRERTGGTLERLLASPLTRFDLVLGYFGGFLAFSMVQAAVIVGFALYVLDVPTAGGMFPVVLLLVLTILTAEGFGIFFSTFAHSEFQVMQMLPIFVFPQLFLCGIVWKIKNLPEFLKPLAMSLPMTYSAQAARDVMVRGDLVAGYTQMGYLSLFLLLSIVLSVAAMRRRIL
ncbi:ABC transporter permease [Myxococcota bacterium]|nr:ABC transporter permease [Myxococcota bacterium]